MKEFSETIQLQQGVFTVSLDFELIWGTLDLFGPERFRRRCEIERARIIDGLLALFVEYNISATWCVLGHLFLDHCTAKNGNKHPEIVRPAHSWFQEDWFCHDPCDTEESESIFLGRTLVEKIRACAVPQEIGSHSFSHVIFGDPGCSRATAESEIAECVRLGQGMGMSLRSFAFPRNKVGYLGVLRDHGFACYRGPEPCWYDGVQFPAPVRRLLHLWDVLMASTPPVVLPEKTESGLWNIPGSMIYFPMHGFRKYIPVSLRIKRAIKGLDAAAREKRVFHLWFHPTNLADQTERMFEGLRAILEHSTALRNAGVLEALPMRSVAGAGALFGATRSEGANSGNR